MLKNFHIVRPNLFRGSAPSPRDVMELCKNFGIRKIISLDEDSGSLVEPICKKLGVDHILIPIEPNNINSLKYLLSKNIHSLVQDSVPTFVHCCRGKDRAGLLVALVRCLLDGWDCKKSVQEAKSLGFGTGLDFATEKLYTKLICRACNDHVDNNAAHDIMDNLLDMNSQYIDYQMDPVQHSWAPYADNSSNNYPEGYTNRDDSFDVPTRHNYGLKGITIEEEDVNQIPMVGVYDQNTQITNYTGPSLVGGGFV